MNNWYEGDEKVGATGESFSPPPLSLPSREGRNPDRYHLVRDVYSLRSLRVL